MTMNVVLGDGELPGKELDALLLDMQRKANKVDDPFWFLVQGKAEPTATDTRLVQWLIAQDVYYEMVSDGSESDLYQGYQKKYTVKRLAPKVVGLMAEVPDEGEEARLLALFASDDPDAEEDRWLNDAIQAVADAGYTVLAMNDGMQEIRVIAVEEAEEEAEDEPVAETPKKAAGASKKAAAAKAPEPEEAEAEAPTETTRMLYTREELEELDLDGLKAVAAKVGISLPPRTRMLTYIEAILGNTKDDEVEVTDVDVDVDDEPEMNTTTTTGSTNITTASSTIMLTEVTAPAMLIVVYNGTVVSRAVTEDEARSLIG